VPLVIVGLVTAFNSLLIAGSQEPFEASILAVDTSALDPEDLENSANTLDCLKRVLALLILACLAGQSTDLASSLDASIEFTKGVLRLLFAGFTFELPGMPTVIRAPFVTGMVVATLWPIVDLILRAVRGA